jgi:hypothetical protein
MRANTTCRTCGMPIRWVITAASGKRMPLDPDPVPDGNVWIESMNQGTPVVGVGLTRADVPRSVPFAYVSHFVTCPDSAEWRNK